MATLLRYWTIWRLKTGNRGGIFPQGYVLPAAREFLHDRFEQWIDGSNDNNRFSLSPSQERSLQESLLGRVRTQDDCEDKLRDRVLAGLCLRCYISYDILKACQKLASRFGGSQQLNYLELLPFVFNDDGKTPIFLGKDGKSQWILHPNGSTSKSSRRCWSVEVLQSYQPNAKSQNLTNWTYLLVGQNKEVKRVLLDYSIQISSPWSLLKRAKSRRLGELVDRDRHLVEVFQNIYCRDRRLENNRVSRCLAPTSQQLLEISNELNKRGIAMNSTRDLLGELKDIADRLRQTEIWLQRKHPDDRTLTTLEKINPESGEEIDYLADPNSTPDANARDRQAFLEFLYAQLDSTLDFGIDRGIGDRISELKRSKRYAEFAEQFHQGLYLLYVRNLSQRQIAVEFGISSQSKVSRIFSPKLLLAQVRFRTLEKLLDLLVQKAEELGLTRIPPDKNYLSNLVKQLETFADAEVFGRASVELMAGSNRSLGSVYAEKLTHYLEARMGGETND